MIKLVVVDDHEALRDALATVLAGHAIEVVGTASSAAAAIDTVRHTTPDIALIDVSLPDGDAIALTRELLAEHGSLAVMLYSDEADLEMLRQGSAAGARGHALKRGSLRELLEAIRAVAAGEVYVDPRLDSSASTAPEQRLSPREKEVLTLIAHGFTADAAGKQLGVSVETVRTHTRNAVRKIDGRNRVHAIAIALRSGEIELGEY
ncbi:MAG TPA: response regulator transcription factor [Baekduia sp.]|nr:response regulator transcription factor [Baekduia sp.]